MSERYLPYFDIPPEEWSILGFFKFQSRQDNFSGSSRKENSQLKKSSNPNAEDAKFSAQKTLRDMHKTLVKDIVASENGAVSKSV
ncbi:hypothetical protein BC936DRAFT_139984 [Jimgerdemannia flammicorona]|uniref:Uncharacterized protein n=1 Tax=Jimgerdemannia flammicorona TaxID=994334 RepID=A0A433B8U7_9FUNG|nr:hypothetical protein BC936DRAFT_139984 [Jimgerdemannia flammicorona]